MSRKDKARKEAAKLIGKEIQAAYESGNVAHIGLYDSLSDDGRGASIKEAMKDIPFSAADIDLYNSLSSEQQKVATAAMESAARSVASEEAARSVAAAQARAASKADKPPKRKLEFPDVFAGVMMGIFSPIIIPGVLLWAIGSTIVDLVVLSIDSIKKAVRSKWENVKKLRIVQALKQATDKYSKLIRHGLDKGVFATPDIGIYNDNDEYSMEVETFDENDHSLGTMTLKSNKAADDVRNLKEGDVLYA